MHEHAGVEQAAEPAARAATVAAPAAPPHVAAMRFLQASAGNQSLARLLARHPAAAGGGCGCGGTCGGCGGGHDHHDHHDDHEDREDEHDHDEGDRRDRREGPGPKVLRQDKPSEGEPAPPPRGELLPGSPFASLPAPVLATLKRSYVDNEMVGSGEPTLDKALGDWGASAIATIVSVYHRASALGLWDKVQYLHHAWTTTSRGIQIKPPDAMRAAVMADTVHFCKDTIVGEAWHGGASCWREIIEGTPGLHFCDDGGAGDLHIDMHQAVSGTLPSVDIGGGVFNPKIGTRCAYSVVAFFSHISDVAGPGPKATVFERVDTAFVRRGKLSGTVTTEVGASHLTKESGAAFEAELLALRSRLLVVWPEVQRYAVGGFDKDAGGGPIENAKNVTDELEAVEAGLEGVAVRIQEAVAATGSGGGPGGPVPSGPQDSGGGVPAGPPPQ